MSKPGKPEGIDLDEFKGVRLDGIAPTNSFHSDVLQSLRPHFEELAKTIEDFNDRIQKPLPAVFQAAQDFQKKIDRIQPILQQYQDQAQRWQSTIWRITEQINFKMTVPQVVSGPAVDLASTVTEMGVEVEGDFLPDKEEVKKKGIQWGKVIGIVWIGVQVLDMIYGVVSNVQTSHQSEAIQQNQQILTEKVDRVIKAVDSCIEKDSSE